MRLRTKFLGICIGAVGAAAVYESQNTKPSVPVVGETTKFKEPKINDAMLAYTVHMTMNYGRAASSSETFAFYAAYNAAQKAVKMIHDIDNGKVSMEDQSKRAMDRKVVQSMLIPMMNAARLDFENDKHVEMLGVLKDDIFVWRVLTKPSPPEMPQEQPRAPVSPSLRPTA